MQNQFLYPNAPGYKEQNETSQNAANEIAEKVTGLRLAVLKSLQNGDKTPDEVAAEIGITILSIRPRFSELLKMGLIEKTDKKRLSIHAKPQRVFKAKPCQQ